MPTLPNSYPSAFTARLSDPSKKLNMTLQIDGLDVIYCITPVYKTIVYGDPITYGEPGVYYGGGMLLDNSRPYISTQSSLNFSQKIEPEQGRGSITTFSIVLIDKNGEVSQVMSPGGGILPEILGVNCTIRIGFADTGFPQNYYVAFRGIITNVVANSGQVTVTIGDANQKRRSAVFPSETVTLLSNINDTTLTIPTTDATAFYNPILGPDNTYDSTVKLYAKIDDEIILYSTTTSGQINAVTRGARGTVAAPHNANASITQSIEVTDHPLTIALKIMLSGWDGPFLTGIVPQALGTNFNPATPSVHNAIVLPIDKDAVIDYGLSIGDFVTVSGSTMGNNGDYPITAFNKAQNTNNAVIRIATALAYEVSNSLSLSFRSKYDTYPISAGLKLSPMDVDVAQHEYLRDDFLNAGDYIMRPYIQDQQVGKDFIESELYYPIACYSLTRFGRLSVNETTPPIANTSLQILTAANVLNAQSITNTRGMNNRKFFNEIQYSYDLQDDGSTYSTVLTSLDTDSLNLIGIVSLLPIQSSGLKSDLGAASLISRVSINFLNRYKRGASEIAMTVNFSVGAQIVCGDVVAVVDNGFLKITDFNTGEQNLGTQLFEVTDWSLDLKTGLVKLKLVSGVQGQAADRYGTVSPSSLVADFPFSTSTQLQVNSSYSAVSGDETLKWDGYIGQSVIVRTFDWGVSGQSTISSLDDSSIPYIINLGAALPFTPTAGMIVDIPKYPTDTNPITNALYKAIHGFSDPTINIVTATASTAFSVSASDIQKFNANAIIYVRDSTFTNISPNVKVGTATSGTNIVTCGDLGFTPSGGNYYAELVGFADLGPGYRIFT